MQRHSLVGFAVGVVKKFGDDRGGKHAALLAYYGFVSMFPLRRWWVVRPTDQTPRSSFGIRSAAAS